MPFLSLSPILQVTVTKEDIKEGNRLSCFSCPIARAVSRELGKDVSVGPLGIFESPEASNPFLQVPYEAKLFMHAFDKGQPVHPQTFTFHPLK